MKIIQFFKEFNASMDASADNYVAKHHNEKLFLSWIIFFSMCVFLGSICAILIFTGIVPPMNNRWAVWQYSFMTIVALISPYNMVRSIHVVRNASWHLYHQIDNTLAKLFD